MLTPQEVSERAFAKAGFGGYNMAMVDEFLDQLTEDYTTLYKENAALKSKMKVLVEKVEEYRSTEEAMRKALLTAQKMADNMIKEAETAKDSLLRQAEEEARKRVAGLRQEVETQQFRLTAAQNATTAYVAKLKELYQHELEYLSALDKLAPAPLQEPDPVAAAAQDIHATVDHLAREESGGLEDTKAAPAVEEPPEAQPPLKDEEERPGGLYGDLTAAFARQETGTEHARHLSIDLENLPFGENYEIK